MKIRFVIFLLFCSFVIYSQTDDFEIWSGVSIEKEISDKFNLTSETQLRLNNNATSFDALLSELELEYKLSRKVRMAVCYRFSEKTETEGYAYSQHRFNVDLTLRQNWKRYRFRFRNRFQTRYSKIVSDESGLIPKNVYRSKFSIAYNIRKNPITPQIAGELYYQLSPGEDHGFSKYRLRGGLGYKLNDNSDVDIFYMMERGISYSENSTAYILGIGYSYSF